MEFFQCIEKRRSYRAFVQKSVERSVLEKIFGAANRSPSYKNTQPWEVFVVAGEKKDALAQKLLEKASSEVKPGPHIPLVEAWPEALERRAEEHMVRRFKALGIDPEQKDQIRQGQLKNFTFFDAPCAVFVGMDRTLTSWSIFDLGLFVHGLLLGLEAEGLGGCPQAMPTTYPDTIRAALNVPDSFCIVLAISIGYPDLDAPINQYHTGRRDLDEFVHWFGL
jgi:nitroreductase